MRVILRENIRNLGSTGDIVKVSDGYARNFLLPRRLVAVADERNVTQLEHFKRVLSAKRAQQKEASRGIAEKLSAQEVTLSRKVGKNDKLFGSVTSSDVAEALTQAGFEVEKTQVQIKEPIKKLGVHSVEIKLDTDVFASVKVWVVKEE